MAKLYSTTDVAKMLTSSSDRYDSRRARRFIERAGIGVRVGGRVYTTSERIAEVLPELHREMMIEEIETDLSIGDIFA